MRSSTASPKHALKETQTIPKFMIPLSNLKDKYQPILFDNRNTYLSVYKESITRIAENGDQFGEIIRLAYFSQNDEVLVDQEGLYLLQKYSLFQIGFLGFLGYNELSKSFIIDTIINLSSNQGNHFTNVYGQSQEQAIFIWSIPFSHNSKLKIFMLSCSGIPQNSQQLNRRHQILIDLMLMLSSTLAIVNIPDLTIQKSKRIFEEKLKKKAQISQSLQNSLNFLQQSQKRIVSNISSFQAQNSFWPQSAYFFQPFKFQTSLQNNLKRLFNCCTFIETDSPLLHKDQDLQEMLLSLNESVSKVNPQFIKMVSQFFIESARQLTSKQYQGLRMTGNIMCKLLINSTKYMSKKTTVKIDKIFHSIFKQLYQASLLYHTENYQMLLQSQFTNEDPMTLDSLLTVFERVETSIMDSFNQNVINQTIHQVYQQKLMDHIEEKQKLLMDVNFKKTKQSVSTKLKNLHKTTSFEPEYIRKHIQNLKSIVISQNHHPIQLIIDSLLKYSNNLEQQIIDQKVKIEKQKINSLKQTKKQLYSQYLSAKQSNENLQKINQSNEKHYKRAAKELNQNQNKIRSIKKDIETERKFQKEYMISKESKKQKAELLLEKIREMEEKVRENAKHMDEINKEYDYHPVILALNKKIEDQEKEIKLLERNQSHITSILPTSFVRPDVQKLPQNVSQRSSIRQVLKSSESSIDRKPIKRLTSSKK